MARTDEAELLTECREALGYSRRGLAKFLGQSDDRNIRRREQGEERIPTLWWIVLFYMLRDNGKRELMNRVHHLVQQRRPG
jgi:hypothetical protein